MSTDTQWADQMVAILLDAPESQLDKAMRPIIRKWSNPPKAVQVLEVLDQCVHGALASQVVMIAVQKLYEDACRHENTTHEEVVKQATWRRQ